MQAGHLPDWKHSHTHWFTLRQQSWPVATETFIVSKPKIFTICPLCSFSNPCMRSLKFILLVFSKKVFFFYLHSLPLEANFEINEETYLTWITICVGHLNSMYEIRWGIKHLKKNYEPYEYTSNHLIHLQIVNFVIDELYLKKLFKTLLRTL